MAIGSISNRFEVVKAHLNILDEACRASEVREPGVVDKIDEAFQNINEAHTAFQQRYLDVRSPQTDKVQSPSERAEQSDNEENAQNEQSEEDPYKGKRESTIRKEAQEAGIDVEGKNRDQLVSELRDSDALVSDDE